MISKLKSLPPLSSPHSRQRQWQNEGQILSNANALVSPTMRRNPVLSKEANKRRDIYNAELKKKKTPSIHNHPYHCPLLSLPIFLFRSYIASFRSPHRNWRHHRSQPWPQFVLRCLRAFAWCYPWLQPFGSHQHASRRNWSCQQVKYSPWNRRG